MKVLGIGGSVHDFAACLVEDGRIVVAIEEERLSRIKHHSLGELSARDLTLRSVPYCMDAATVDPKDLAAVYTNDLVLPSMLRDHPDAVPLNHHLTHAACCFLLSPYERAAILVADGLGSMSGNEAETVSYFLGDGTDIQLVKRFRGRLCRRDEGRPFAWDNYDGVEDSLGAFYALISETIGFRRHEEGKMMGLAAYGTQRYHGVVSSMLSGTTDQLFAINARSRTALRCHILDEIGAAGSDDEEFQVRADFAAAAQEVLEEAVLGHVRELRDLVPADNLCLAGGVFMNANANGRVIRESPFHSVFVHGAAGDNGTALGAALYGYYQMSGDSRVEVPLAEGIYTGRPYGASALKSAVAEYAGEIEATYHKDICGVVAKALAEGAIVGWFQGGAEFGARALGNRSILADPRDATVRDVVNQRIKGREWFRPLAPSVLDEMRARFFDVRQPAPFMTVTARVVEKEKAKLGAVTHVDSSARLQTVDSRTNPTYHKLIQAFGEITGVPVLLNTSFNENEPIVETPAQAIDAYLRTDIDYLVIGNHLVRKRVSGPEG